MVIAVNARSIKPACEYECGEFIYECFKRIIGQHPEHTFIFLTKGNCDEQVIEAPNVTYLNLSFQSRYTFISWIRIIFRLRVLLRKYLADVYISDDLFCPLIIDCPAYLLMTDASIINIPKSIIATHKVFSRMTNFSGLKKARKIGTLSEHLKQEIIRVYNIESARIDVLYTGVGEDFLPISFKEKESIKNKISEGNEYFLTAYTVDDIKNFVTLLKAFSAFKKRQKSNMYLVIINRNSGLAKEIAELLRTYKYRDQVKLIEQVSQLNMSQIVAGAYAVVYPWAAEVIRRPMIEAMRCRVPILTGNLISNREVAGDAAIYFDSSDYHIISEKMQLIFKDEQLRQRLISKGEEQSQLFSWDITADLLWKGIVASSTS